MVQKDRTHQSMPQPSKIIEIVELKEESVPSASTTNEFIKGRSGWAGEKEDNTNTTTKTGSAKTNRRSMW
ncbi:MAG: hypothetical protein ABFQ64_05960 [Campylobacterota bacterium]